MAGVGSEIAVQDGGRRLQHESLGCGAFGGLCFLIAVPMLLIVVQSQVEQPVSSHRDMLWMFLPGYILYLGECFCCSKTSKYLTNVCGWAKFRDFVEHLQVSNPKITFSIQCWHNEWVTVTIAPTEHDMAMQRKGKGTGKGRTERKEQRVNTHYAEMEYPIATHKDETLSPTQGLAMFQATGEKARIVLCSFPMDFYPHNSQVEEHFRITKERFYSNNTEDKNQDKRERRTVDFKAGRGYMGRMMVILGNPDCESASRPWWMEYWFYALCSVFLMTIPYRLCFFQRTATMDWNVTKHYSNLSNEQTEVEEPLYSLKKSKDPLLAKIVREGHSDLS